MTQPEIVRGIMDALEDRPVRYTVEELRAFVAQAMLRPRTDDRKKYQKIYNNSDKEMIRRLAASFERRMRADNTWDCYDTDVDGPKILYAPKAKDG